MAKYVMFKKTPTLFILPIIFLISCSESNNTTNPSSFVDDPLNLKTGQCYIDYTLLDQEFGDNAVEIGGVEVVSCLSPHNMEVTAVFASVPLSYRDSPTPVSDLCVSESRALLESIVPIKNSIEFFQIATEFDKKFKTQMYAYPTEIGKNDMDLDNTVVCSISSGYTLSKNSLSEALKELI
tara:strand:+ start:6162 stop:6704 length:543 start_codon:yes stop_codon:yes gene_type:complete